MLRARKHRRQDGKGLRIGIVASKYNPLYVNGMLKAARTVLEEAGAEVEVVRVPGAFEIPVAAARWLRASGRGFDAVICLGVIWQGQTDHAQQVGDAVTTALMSLQLETGVPCVHEVLGIRTEEQAQARCLDPETNKGLEAAFTALEMGRLLRRMGRAGQPTGMRE